MDKHSLRHIKKEATAHALSEAAFQLALERGLDGFVVDEVAQRAGYSRRTFANHFTCKEEAVASAAFPSDDMIGAEEMMMDLTESATPLDLLHYWLKAQFTAELFRRMRDLMSLSVRYPTLEPYILSTFRRMQTAACEMINFHFQGRYSEEYSHLLIGAVYGAILPVIDGSLQILLPTDSTEETPDAVTFGEYLDTIFGYLRNGF
ncbi:TetR/AcrR family transcriptional regulator [Paenibacillus sp. NPDC058071]|uniref:TetR/AcrR family transcriptional regulator n=1 Tax=Paenibacillus sp. NPDC058071 TaxID=3346326 RepID=UPI0036DD3CE1